MKEINFQTVKNKIKKLIKSGEDVYLLSTTLEIEKIIIHNNSSKILIQGYDATKFFTKKEIEELFKFAIEQYQAHWNQEHEITAKKYLNQHNKFWGIVIFIFIVGILYCIISPWLTSLLN